MVKLYRWLDKHFYLQGLAIGLMVFTIGAVPTYFLRPFEWWRPLVHGLCISPLIALSYVVQKRRTA